MMISIKKSVVLVILALVLLLSLLGWSVRMVIMPAMGMPHSTGIHSTHLLASGDGDNDADDGGTGADADDNYICPPPPRMC